MTRVKLPWVRTPGTPGPRKLPWVRTLEWSIWSDASVDKRLNRSHTPVMTKRSKTRWGDAATRILLVLGMASLIGGCMNRVADHCSSCAVVKEATRLPPEMVRDDKRSLVVLVHGAFGFGSEWEPVVAALRDSPQAAFVVFEWRGPFHDLTGTSADLAALVQRALDQTPSPSEVLVLAHSAGGPLATRAALRLRVPEGKHVMLAEIDSPTFMKGRPFFAERIGAEPEMPIGVERIVYLARNPPKTPPARTAARVYLGSSVSHNQAVALAGLPLVAKLSKASPYPQ